MSILSADAVRRLEAVRDAILAEPELYDQRNYYDYKNPCGGACCIAGWLLWQESPSDFFAATEERLFSWEGKARNLLGVDCDETYGSYLLGVDCDETYRSYGLFGAGFGWHFPFNTQFRQAKSRNEQAQIAAAYIDFLIKRDGPTEAA